MARSSAVVRPTEYPKQVQEQVQEVQVKGEGSDDAQLREGLLIDGRAVLLVHPDDLLCVIGGKAQEDAHPNETDQVIKTGRAEEQVDQACTDQTPQSHHQIRAHAIEIPLGGHGIQAHTPEHQGGGKEGLVDDHPSVHCKDGAEHDPVECRIGKEGDDGTHLAHPVQSSREVEDQGKLSDHDQKEAHGIADNGPQQRGVACNEKGDDGSQTQPCCHPQVYVLEYGALTHCYILQK
ncbi:hypothetical protein SDC9_105730 [bioreactor metagenome]|uniref:Uncharacterized protein n=1 Tax=bioreactor metagenome TaxID=1076179 RepID=A0A645B0E9_9ZZZZ